MKSIGTSRIGLVRKANEDSFYTDDSILIVADGMGGHAGGEIASSLAVKEIQSFLRQEEKITVDTLTAAIETANKKIYEYMLKEPTLKGMGTTVVLAYVKPRQILWANVGDSRLYHFRDNKLSRISTDHSIVQTFVDAGAISEEEARIHPQRNVLTRAVGVDSVVEVDHGVLPIHKGDKILLCTDGITSSLSEDVISTTLQNEATEKQMLDTLISLVYKEGAKDNVTLIIATL